MKRTFIRVMLVEVDDIEALKVKQAIEKLVKDYPSSNVEFSITKSQSPLGGPPLTDRTV